MPSFARLPLIKPMLTYHRTTLFCRNLGVLLASGVALPTTLRILVDMMATTQRSARSGRRWSSACATAASCRTR